MVPSVKNLKEIFVCPMPIKCLVFQKDYSVQSGRNSPDVPFKKDTLPHLSTVKLFIGSQFMEKIIKLDKSK
jgi:hypothetical protein